MSFVMPVSPDGKPLYNAGSSTADVCMLIGNGSTVREIKRALNSDVAFYVIERHAGINGRRGLRAQLSLNGKPCAPFTKQSFAALADSDRISAVYEPCAKFVNSRHPRSTPADTATIVSARSTVSETKPAVSPTPAPAVAPAVAQTTVKSAVKSSAKRAVKKS